MSRLSSELYGYFRDLGITVRKDEPLKNHTSFRLGGTADLWVEPDSIEMLSRALEEVHKLDYPRMILGGGTNILFPDGGYRGMVLSTLGLVSLTSDGNAITAQAGVPLSRIVSHSLNLGLDGLAEMTGIPGSIGGAVRGNAGAYGSSIGSVVDSITILDETGIPRSLKGSECGFDYRYCNVAIDDVIADVRCVFRPDDPQKIRKIARDIIHDRMEKQPLGERSAGCIFKNPPEEFAGRLLDDMGLKGSRKGGARISERHANWIIVDETATAKDVVDLIEWIRSRVYEERDTVLETELVIVEPYS